MATASGSLINRISVSTHDKAGLASVDKAKIDQVIFDASKDSRFFKNEQRKNERIRQQVERIRQLLSKIGTPNSHIADEYIAEIEAHRDLTHVIFHVDMDAFYAAVEIRDRPELAGKPVAVGGNAMLSTASYEARKYGVRSAMPGFIARKLCPNLIIIKPNFDKYKDASAKAREVFSIYDPCFEMMSLDEAYLDVTDYLHQFPTPVTPEDLASEIRRNITAATGGLTCSIGIACNRMLAKIATSINKPNGQYRVPSQREEIIEFMRTMHVRKIPGIGKVTEALLRDALNITTCEDIVRNREILFRVFRPLSARFFLRAALGVQSIEAKTDRPHRHSISKERTFGGGPWSNSVQMEALCKELCRKLAAAVAKKCAASGGTLEGRGGRTISVKMKDVDFAVRTRSETLPRVISSADELFQHAVDILRRERPARRLRLLGVRLSSLVGVEGDDTEEGSGENSEIEQRHSKQGPLRQVFAALSSLAVTTAASASHQEGEGQDDLLYDMSADEEEPDEETEAGPCDEDSTTKHNDLRIRAAHTAGKARASAKRVDIVTLLRKAQQQQQEPVRCPICNVVLPDTDNRSVNEHIDACLGINTTVSSEQRSVQEGNSTKKRKQEAQGAGSPPKKRRPSEGTSLDGTKQVTLLQMLQADK